MNIDNIKNCYHDIKNFSLFEKHELFRLVDPDNVNKEWLNDGDLYKEVRKLTPREYIGSLYKILKINLLE